MRFVGDMTAKFARSDLRFLTCNWLTIVVCEEVSFLSGNTCTATDVFLGDLGRSFPHTVNIQAFVFMGVSSRPFSCFSGDFTWM